MGHEKIRTTPNDPFPPGSKLRQISSGRRRNRFLMAADRGDSVFSWGTHSYELLTGFSGKGRFITPGRKKELFFRLLQVQ